MSTARKDREYKFTQQDFDFLREAANQRTGIVVSDDKFDMFYSRLARRVRSLRLNSFSDYCDLIRANPNGDEVEQLVNSITTNLTAFFRENHHFEFLRDTVIPQCTVTNGGAGKLSLWSAGCSTGEEPYSLAITLAELMPRLGGCRPEILATDIDSNVLATASAGVYPLARVEGLSPQRLKRWFQKGRKSNVGKARVKPELQKLIKFRRLNLMDSWQVETKDVIFCRNVIIYFDKESKQRLVNRFADALKPGGYLFIGHSESLFKVTDRFELIGHTVYRKVG